MPTQAELHARLMRERPPCGVCRRPVDPRKGRVAILFFAQDEDTSVMVPVHGACEADAYKKLEDVAKARKERNGQ